MEEMEKLRGRLEGVFDSGTIKSIVVIGETEARYFTEAFADGVSGLLRLVGQLEVTKLELLNQIKLKHESGE